MEPYIIAETAYNHEGDLSYLYKMIDDISEIGLNAVKFHLMLNVDSYMQKKHPLKPMLSKWIFDESQWNDIFNYCLEKNLDIVGLCDDVESLKFINERHTYLKAIELHASCLNDYFLMKEALNFPNTIILGIGGSTIDEIEYVVNFFKENNKNDILLMYGFQAYPTDYSEINLFKMLKIKELFNLPIGYADHTAYNDKNNIEVSSLGAALGIRILEKHYTPDFGVGRIDYHSAVGKEHMIKIMEKMKLYLTVYGSGNISMSKSELKYGNTGPMKKAIVARKPIKKGKKLELEDLWFKRTEEESSIKQNQLMSLIGLETNKDIDEDEIIDFSKLKYEFGKRNLSDLTGGLGDK